MKLSELKGLAEKATPGRWDFYLKHEDPSFPTTIAFSQIASYDKETKTHIVMCRLGVPDKICMEKANAEFITSANPAQVLKLIEGLEISEYTLTLANAQLKYLNDLFRNEGCDNSVVIDSIETCLSKLKTLGLVE